MVITNGDWRTIMGRYPMRNQGAMKVYRGLFFAAAAWLLLAIGANGQTAVPDDITAEPHHHLLMQNEDVRVFEVVLRQTEHAFVRHAYNFLVITLEDSELVMWNEGESEILNFRFGQGDIRFFYGGGARGVRNDRTGEYHNITVEFINPKVTTFGYRATTGKWDYNSSGVNPPLDSSKKFHNTLNMGQADVSDVQLLQRDILEPPDKGIAELLIPLTDLDMKTGSDVHIRKLPGDVWWIGAGRKNDLMNSVMSPARFVLVELKPPQN
jgi:hypothetical protein